VALIVDQDPFPRAYHYRRLPKDFQHRVRLLTGASEIKFVWVKDVTILSSTGEKLKATNIQYDDQDLTITFSVERLPITSSKNSRLQFECSIEVESEKVTMKTFSKEFNCVSGESQFFWALSRLFFSDIGLNDSNAIPWILFSNMMRYYFCFRSGFKEVPKEFTLGDMQWLHSKYFGKYVSYKIEIIPSYSLAGNSPVVTLSQCNNFWAFLRTFVAPMKLINRSLFQLWEHG
jgi:hypothetical protein